MSGDPHPRPVAVVVGGTRGIGKEVARQLVGAGEDVTIVGRAGPTGPAAAEEVGAAFIAADVSSLAEVRRLAGGLAERHHRVHRLVQSADVLISRRAETPEGLEVSFATNYLSRFLLVGLLLDQLLAGPSSVLHIAAAGAPGRLRLADVPPGPRLGAFRAHGVGQGANDVYGAELAARLAGTGTTVHVANPGAVDTGIRDEVAATPLGRVVMPVLGAVMRVRSPDQVARALLDGVRRFPDDVLIGPRGTPVRVPARARDLELRRALWDRSEQLTGLRVPLGTRS